MVQRSGEGPLLPEELAITIRAALGDQCQWAVSHSGETLHVDGIDRSGDRQSFRFGPPNRRVPRPVLETCLRRFGLSDTGTAGYLRGRLL